MPHLQLRWRSIARLAARLRTTALCTLPLLLAGVAVGQLPAINSPDGKPLSQRVVAYAIDARLNTTAKTLDATETLEYRNFSDQPLSKFPFHMYLNAFRPQSSFSREVHQDTAEASAGKKRAAPSR